MTSRERVIATYAFKQTDRTAYDLAESKSWKEMRAYFLEKYGIDTHEGIIEFLDPDFRWVEHIYCGPDKSGPDYPYYGLLDTHMNTPTEKPPLADATTISDVLAYKMPDTKWWEPPDFAAAREKWPNYALVFQPVSVPLFLCACYVFGTQTALTHMAAEQDLFEAYMRMHNEVYLEILAKAIPKAKAYCDICWLADDYAGQLDMMFSPEIYKKMIKPHLAKQVDLVRSAGMDVLFHSCGSVRSILPDLLDIGVNSMLVFQTTARGMDARSIARDFGGKMVFYGGIDSQDLLTFGTAEQVEAEVTHNIRVFENCGGYIVSNCHHGLADIQSSNIEIMCKTARETLL